MHTAKTLLCLTLLCLTLLCCTPAFAAVHDHSAEAAFEGAVAAQQPATAGGSGETVINVPPTDAGADTMEARGRAEKATIEKFQVPIGFQFHDALQASGIRFRHGIVDDAGKTYKAAHYDHGNGLAVADVDGDGRVDLYFTTQLGKNGLWRSTGAGKFEDITEKAGVALADQISVSAAFGDIDNDGDADLYVTTVRKGNHLFLNDGKGKFQDVSKAAGVDYVGHSSGAVFFDYDRDGKLDLFVVNVGKYTGETQGRGGFYVAYEDAFQGHTHPERDEASILYHNLGGAKFEDATAKAGIKAATWSGDASSVDFNRDGYPDLFVLSMQGRTRYWENQGGKGFVDKTKQYFPRTSWGAMGLKFFDFDNDGDEDLFVSDMHSDMFQDSEPQDERIKFLYKGNADFLGGPPESFIFGNSFFKNQGDGSFKEASDEIWTENYWPWGISVADVNADGYQDVFLVSSMNFPWRYGVNSLLINNAAKEFLNAEFLTAIEPRPGGKTRQTWFTLDCAGEDKAHRLCANQTGKVAVTGTLGSRSSVFFDLDDDGDLDLVTGEFNDAPQVLLSDLAAKGKIHYLQVRLHGGKGSNRDGLGAMVKVKAGGKTYTQFHDGASGYLAHSLLPLYFGLGASEKVDSIEVTWPSGKKTSLAGPLGANRTVDLKEDGAPGGEKKGTK
jgi:hypothetical protein